MTQLHTSHTANPSAGPRCYLQSEPVLGSCSLQTRLVRHILSGRIPCSQASGADLPLDQPDAISLVSRQRLHDFTVTSDQCVVLSTGYFIEPNM